MKSARISAAGNVSAVAPARGRGLKLTRAQRVEAGKIVAPARGRGLKYEMDGRRRGKISSPPQGGVD